MSEEGAESASTTNPLVQVGVKLAVEAAAEARVTRAPRASGKRRQAPARWSAENELHAFELVKLSFAEHHEALDDPELLLILAEGQTSLVETLDAMLEADLNDEGLLEGLRLIKDTVMVRLHRLEERRKSRRVIFEQTLLALSLRCLERPAATLSLSERPPVVDVIEEAIIPTRFFAMRPVLDRRMLKAALDAGEEVAGAKLTGAMLTLTVRRR